GSAIGSAAGSDLWVLFANDLNENSLLSSAIKLSIEDLLPGSKVQLTARNSDDHLASHDLPLDMRIGIVLSGVVVPILAHRLMRHEPFEKVVVIFQKARLVVVDIDACADMHRIHEA